MLTSVGSTIEAKVEPAQERVLELLAALMGMGSRSVGSMPTEMVELRRGAGWITTSLPQRWTKPVSERVISASSATIGWGRRQTTSSISHALDVFWAPRARVISGECAGRVNGRQQPGGDGIDIEIE